MMSLASRGNGAGRRAELWRWLEASALFAVMLACYLGNGRTIWAGDTIANRYLPVALVRDRSFTLDEFPFLYSGKLPYWLKHVRRGVVSFYPVSGALLAVPVYLPTVLTGEPRDSPRWAVLEKRSAATIVALSVAVLFAALRRVASPGMALLAAVAYGLGSSSFSVAGQALWQHGPMQLGVALALYALVRGREDERWISLAAPALAFSALSRPTGFLVGIPLSVYLLLRHPRQALLGVVLASPILSFHAWYNLHYYGDVFWTQIPFQDWKWKGRPVESWSGMLFSPSRGLFVYSPVFAFSLVTLVGAWRRRGDALLRAVSASVLMVVAFYGKWKPWSGGGTFGPRLLSDLTPLLAFALYPLQRGLCERVIVRSLFAVALLWSIAAHAIGAYWDEEAWTVPNTPQRLWSWTDNQLVNPVALRVTRLVDRALRIPIPVGALLERHLREQLVGRPWSDEAIRTLRDLYGDAQYGDGVAEMERLLAEQFSPRVRLDWSFGGVLTLVGYDFTPLEGRQLEITYYWRAERPLEQSYFASVHFQNDGFRFQDDHALGVPGYATERWHAGETVNIVRRVTPPPQAPAGTYALQLGIWAPAEGSRLRLRDGSWRGAKDGRLLSLEIGDREIRTGSR